MSRLPIVEFGGNLNPEQALLGALEVAADCEDVVIVLRMKDGEVLLGSSSSLHLTKIGMLELAKHDLLSGMSDD